MRTRFSYRLGVTTVLALALLGATAAAVQASTTVNQWDPLNATTTGDTCIPQAITFTGKGHVLITYTQDANGGYSGTVHGNLADVKGTDASGNTYTFLTELESSFTSNGASTFTAVGDQAIISHGQATNAYGHVLVHMTVDANGDLTSSMTVASISCRG